MKDPKAFVLADELDNTRYKDVVDLLRQQYLQIEDLKNYIKELGKQSNTCTFHVLKEKCSNCQCRRLKLSMSREE